MLMKTGQLHVPYERCPAIIPLPEFRHTVRVDDSVIPEGSEAIIGFT